MGLNGAVCSLAEDCGRDEGWGLCDVGLEAVGEVDMALLWTAAPAQ